MAQKHIAEGVTLPAWASMHPTNKVAIVVDPDIAYPAILKELGEATPNKFNVEVAYQFVKMDLQTAMKTFGFMVLIRSDGGRKDRWALANLPGTDADIAHATNGLAARGLYRKLRGALPA